MWSKTAKFERKLERLYSRAIGANTRPIGDTKIRFVREFLALRDSAPDEKWRRMYYSYGSDIFLLRASTEYLDPETRRELFPIAVDWLRSCKTENPGFSVTEADLRRTILGEDEDTNRP